MTFTADVTLLPTGIDEDLSRELMDLLERDPEQIAVHVRSWLSEDSE